MKIRTCFVSNSSSSSFIVIGSGNKENYNDSYKPEVIFGHCGELTFGCNYETKIFDTYSKINFCFIQIVYLITHKDKEERKKGLHALKLLTKILKKEFNTDNVIYDYGFDFVGYKGKKKVEFKDTQLNDIDWSCILNGCEYKWNSNAWIDHSSSAEEGMNLKCLKNEELLSDFIFCKNSYIFDDRDN